MHQRCLLPCLRPIQRLLLTGTYDRLMNDLFLLFIFEGPWWSLGPQDIFLIRPESHLFIKLVTTEANLFVFYVENVGVAVFKILLS
jgi:hypothetical protein